MVERNNRDVEPIKAERPSRDEVIVTEADTREADRVRQSQPFQDAATDLPDQGDHIDFKRAKTVRKQEGDARYKLAVPLSDMDSFDPLTTVEGLHAHISPESDDIDVVIRYEYNEVSPAELDSSIEQNIVATAATKTGPTTETATTQSNECQYSDITFGYKCNGVYDTEEACTLISGAMALIPADDVSVVGVIDDVLLPAVGAGAAGCAIEQAIEMGVADWLTACSTDNWVWEVYTTRWWNPVPQRFLAIPRCG